MPVQACYFKAPCQPGGIPAQAKKEQHQKDNKAGENMDGVNPRGDKITGSPQVAVGYGRGQVQRRKFPIQPIDLVPQLPGVSGRR